MKISFFAFVLLICMSAQAQKKPVLYYFFGKDSLVGAKDEQGKIVIPARFDFAFYDTEDMRVQEDMILFYKRDTAQRKSLAHSEVASFYDRSGRFLFHPFLYDNGPDYFQEGLRRYVDNNKMGFYDRNNKAVIPARYDFVDPFKYGLAAVCNGCYLYRDTSIKDDEHNTRLTSGAWGLINKKGQLVVPLGKLDSSGPRYSDWRTDKVERYAPFQYNSFEKSLINKAFIYPGFLAQLRHENTDKRNKYRLEIVERPSASFPYYMLETFITNEGLISSAYTTLLISKDGKKIYRYWQFDEEKEPIDKWLKREEEERKN